MADSALCGDIVKYANKVINLSRPAPRPTALAAASMELFEIMACQIGSEPQASSLRRAYQEHDAAQAGTRGDPGINLAYLSSMRSGDIPPLVAYELCHKRRLELEPPVGWGHWLRQFYELTGIMPGPADA
jgi:hypothetical protein